MDGYLKQSTAATVKIGPFLDDSDGKTAKSELTISQADVRLSKNGGDMAQKNSATACSHDELGYYDCPLSTTDTNTLGLLKLMVHEAGALPVWHTYVVLSADVYDSLFGATALATVGAAMTLANDAITAAKFDETTAFPLKSADAGATAVARTGADGDTLETLSDQVDELKAGITAIKNKTDNLPSDPADQSAVEAAIAAIPAAPTTGEIKTALEAAGSHLALILEDTGTSIPDSIEELAAMVEIIKVIKAHKSIENEAGTLITYRNEGDTADAGTQSWNEATKTRGEYTPS